jgi:hypothetical protein
MAEKLNGPLFPANLDPTVITWLLLIGVPLLMLFLTLEKQQWKHTASPAEAHPPMVHSAGS